MNTQKKLTKNYQSMLTMVCKFSRDTLYFGTHEKFTFRGDDLTNNPQEQVKYLKLKRKELLEKYNLWHCTIYDNRSISNLPFKIVLQWYYNNLNIDNERMLYINSEERKPISVSFLKYLEKQNILKIEYEEPQ